ncbi:hypothetical protein [Methylobacterium pseudosasicola]|uniref:Uncharacterized protein n=1 Tax=Methylobacterium pseudosasicola TaxID=582667 RepID=A0A1I4UJ97_9HYPH|nr:hypothetical protein [Methylobacterium pseudosasicola]SFM88793.1 hypothetical protein SAMN05192568_107121 [Methylobacterium pseudosasicola]
MLTVGPAGTAAAGKLRPAKPMPASAAKIKMRMEILFAFAQEDRVGL